MYMGRISSRHSTALLNLKSYTKAEKFKKAEATKGYLISKNPNHSILSNQSVTEKKFKEICENFIPSLEELCDDKSGKVILELDYPGEYCIKAFIDVAVSESNKSSATRAGKILESLNKRSRQLSEGKGVSNANKDINRVQDT